MGAQAPVDGPKRAHLRISFISNLSRLFANAMCRLRHYFAWVESVVRVYRTLDLAHQFY